MSGFTQTAKVIRSKLFIIKKGDTNDPLGSLTLDLLANWQSQKKEKNTRGKLMPQQFFASTDYFDQAQIDNMERAIDRAWQVLQQLEPKECSEEGRKTLALCVLSEAHAGEENHIALVNRAIVRFRAQRAREMIFVRRQASDSHAP